MGTDTGISPRAVARDAPLGATDPADIGILVLRRLSELLATLDARQVGDLATGRARLTVVPVAPDAVEASDAGNTGPRSAEPRGSATAAARAASHRPRRAAAATRHGGPVEPPAGAMLAALGRSLRAAPSREAAMGLIDDLGPLTVPALRKLAADLEIKGVLGRDPRPAVLRKIVEGTVGQRLRSEAIAAPDRT
ncbi:MULTISPECIES: oxidoreductase [unclassified Frankia]|uniref:oxidoreductase n=1 Tax=unclassified Frankia TaxID=2632575 RepID=UPI000E2EB825|nr:MULTISPECIES: oxidoreductase [unclassified Frankia]